MPEAAHLADALRGLFTRPDSGWFTVFPVAVAGLTAEQARCVPAARFNSVWGLVNHVTYWQEYLLKMLRGEPLPTAHKTGDDWGPVGQAGDEAAWHDACQRALAANEALAAYVESLTAEQVNEPSAPGRPRPQQIIQGVIAHNSYHTCEIITVRHMQGWWLERT
jgi:uncharacterized damage-inducible protein DinB